MSREANPASILFLVRDTLRAAGLTERATDFLRRAEACRGRDDVLELATEYVSFEE